MDEGAGQEQNAAGKFRGDTSGTAFDDVIYDSDFDEVWAKKYIFVVGSNNEEEFCKTQYMLENSFAVILYLSTK